MTVLVISESDVESLVDMHKVVSSMEDAFKELGRGKAIVPLRTRLTLPESFGTIRIMSAALLDSQVSGLKVLAGTAGHRSPEGNYFTVLLNDYKDGALKCIMAGSRLTQLRTGALSAVATKFLSRKDSTSVGIVGTGVQGKGQLEAILSLGQFENVNVYDMALDSAKRLVEYASTKFENLKFRIVNSVAELTQNSDVICTSTTSSTPFLNSSNVRKGTHINAIGSNLPSRKEVDPSLLQISRLIVDSKEQALEESGDLEPIKRGILPGETISAELSEVLIGAKAGRTSDTEITIFKSVGIALQDVVAANAIYQEALVRRVGKILDLH